jgi:hypothetical protein
MTHLFTEYEVSKQIRELEALDRRLEHRGWHRGREAGPPAPAWRVRVGEALIGLGFWLQGRGKAEGLGVPGKP